MLGIISYDDIDDHESLGVHRHLFNQIVEDVLLVLFQLGC